MMHIKSIQFDVWSKQKQNMYLLYNVLHIDALSNGMFWKKKCVDLAYILISHYE